MPAGWVLAAGLALFLAGSAVFLGGSRDSWGAIWPWPTVAIPVALAAAAEPQGSAPLLVGGPVVVCLALTVRGTQSRHAVV